MNDVRGNICEVKKKVPPKKPPRLYIRSKSDHDPQFEREKRNFEGMEHKENSPHLGSTGSATYEEIDDFLIDEEKINELDDEVIEVDRLMEKEHIYESIPECLRTKSSSSQTEECTLELRDSFTKEGDLKVYKETSCQTECTEASDATVRRTKKRNSDCQEEDMATPGKTKEYRLSSDSSTSTQELSDSGDSGHFSVRVGNPEQSPTILEHSENKLEQYDVQYLWQPEGLSKDEVRCFMNSLPRDKVPSQLTPEGIAYFNSQLAYQNPKQDADPTLCKSLRKDQDVSLRNVWMNCVKARGTGYIQLSESSENACRSCGVLFNIKEVTVAAADGLRHPSCFSCTACHELLSKLVYYIDENNHLFCGRHYAELFKARCFHCDELVVSGRLVTAMNRTWHAEHFCCSKCKEMITKNQYTTEKEKPICLSCHAIHFAEECEGCGKKIVIGEKRVSHGKKHWHDECFICEKCENTLVLGSFNIADEKVVCRQCYGQNKSKLCCKCGVEIKVKNQWIDYNNQYYHSACFCCQSCHQPISSGFMEHEESFYCTGCYQILFSQKCARCGLPVTGNGVTYSDQVWHTSCFDCFCCRQPISSHKFREHSGDRYCNDCYEKMFRKECHSCCELIKDDAYFTTDDLFWHNGCLTCANCQKDLGSIGFHMVEQETYCSECAEKVY